MTIWANENAEKVVFSTIVNTNIKFLIYSGNVYCTLPSLEPKGHGAQQRRYRKCLLTIK